MRRPLLWALWALCFGAGVSPPGVWGCVLCDPAASITMAELLGSFLVRAVPDQELRERLVPLLLRGALELGRLPRDPQTFMGVIDQPTLAKASVQFRHVLNRVMSQDLKDQQAFNELLWALQEIKDDFEKLMRHFQRHVYCPNKCGRMEVIWIECTSCNLTLFSCDRGSQCGEKRVWVEEGQDLVLDCALPWHGASHGAKTYSFYRAAPPAEKLLRSGPDPVLVWKETPKRAGGPFRCEMRDPRGRLGSELRFNVTVVPRAQLPKNAPLGGPRGSPRGLPPAAIAAVAVTTVAIALGALGCAWFCFRRRDPREEEETPPQ